MEMNSPKGVFDILPRERDPESKWREVHLWQYVESLIRETSRIYGFGEVRTPIFERTELFVRGVGETSDIVSKEMYTFEDKSGRSLTLRPEGTAALMRLFIEKHLDQLQGLHKYFYIGPMFRYERPQAGRYRQHHQFGAEFIGDPTPEADVELIDLVLELYRRLGLKNLKVQLNSVGDENSRTAYREALKVFLQPHLSQLSPESQTRFQKNVLRILDSKDPQDQKFLQGAPSILDLLSQKSRNHFEKVQKLLKQLDVDFEVQPKLVRGLDYYNETVFEITSGQLGAQNAVGGGGRFDGLIASLGGPDLPAVGFATGIERILQVMLSQNCHFPPPTRPLLFLIPIGDKAKEYCFNLVFAMRHKQVPVEIDWQAKRVGHALQCADAMGALYAAVIGDEELSAQMIKVKDMQARTESVVRLNELSLYLENSQEKIC